MKEKIAVLGGGNIGTAFAKGLLKSKLFDAENIIVTRRRLSMLHSLAEKGVITSSDNTMAVKAANIIILAVKPQQAPEILQETAPFLDPEKHIILSLVTGIGTAQIKEMAQTNCPVFLAMPNTALSICESMTCLAHDDEPEASREKIVNLFNHLGHCQVIPEDLMGAATVLAACGIAFALRFLRGISQGGIEIGFGSELSTLIAAQTLKGAAKLTQETGNHPEREIDKVTTPMGITISGLNEMEHNGFSSALIKGLLVSYHKIEKLNQKNQS